MVSIIKKNLIVLIVICISTFSGAHIYEHTKINTHTDEFHTSNFKDHTHLENEHNAFDTHANHHPSIHRHLDGLFLRSVRQKKLEDELFISRVFITQKIFLDTFQFGVFKKPKKYIQTTYYQNYPFISRNQPLLI